MRAVIALLCLAAAYAAAGPFDGHRVVHVPRASRADVQRIEDAGFDIWAMHPSESSVPTDVAMDVMVTDHTQDFLTKLGLSFTVKIPDVQANIDREAREIAESQSHNSTSDVLAAPDDWFLAYKTYDQIVQHLRDLATAYPTFVTFVASIGTSVQGRAIPGIIINSKATTVNRYFHLLGGQHAREWVGPATTIFVAEQLLVQNAAGDPTARAILNRAAFYVAPMTNPDGYVWSWSGSANRLWRKNRRANTGGSFGVDLNRNWDDGKWAQGGSSATPSSDTYHGPSAFSEPESRAVANWVTNQPFRFHGAIDYHAYSQLILRPAGWTNTPTANETALANLGTAVRAEILKFENRPYTSQRSFQLYQTTGTSTDYWYYKASIVFAYCIELRDTGTFGFQLPAAQILPTGRENWLGFRHYVNHIIGLPFAN